MSQPIIERLTSQLQAKGMPDASDAAKRFLTKAGVLDASGELTSYGRQREAMGAAERAKDRAAKRSGHKASEYSYNPRTNGARLRS